MSTAVQGPCHDCGSKDNLAMYEDGGYHCFTPGCGNHKSAGKVKGSRSPKSNAAYPPLTFSALQSRKLTEETCRLFRYGLVEGKGDEGMIQALDAFNAKGDQVGRKLRLPDKDFKWSGKPKDAALFGQHLWAPGGKMITITEGEIDAMSLSQCKDNKYPVVSILGGAQAAFKDLKRQLDYLETFDCIVIMFDMDAPGQKAAKECAELFTPGKCKLATLPLKDANEMLKAGRWDELTNAVWRARVFRPDGIASDEDVWEKITAKDTSTWTTWPWPTLNTALRGLRTEELITVVAGTGVGKSLFVKEVAHHLISNGQKLGYIALEESVKRTALGLMSITMNIPLHLQPPEEMERTAKLPAFKEAFESTIKGGQCVFYDHFGSLESDHLLAKIRYMVKSLDCQFVILDHISIMVSGLDTDDERKALDVTMTKLQSFVQETGCGLIAVCHLRRVSGTAHEEGGSVSLSHIRGTQSIAQLSNGVVGLERNQQSDDPIDKDLTSVRVLKDRFGGYSGLAGTLKYDQVTGRLSEVTTDFDTETKGDF